MDTFKVAVSVEPRPGDTGVAGGPTVSMNEEKMRQGLDDLEKKVRLLHQAIVAHVNPRKPIVFVK